MVWLATAAFALVMLLASALFPIYSVPDEPFHVDMVLAVGQGSGYPQPMQRVLEPEVERSTRLARTRSRSSAAAALPRAQRPGFDELQEPPTPGRLNRMTSHPPLYYAVVSAVSHTAIAMYPPAADLAFDEQVWSYRLLSLLFVAPLPVLAFLIARRLTEDRSVAVAAALVPLAVPGLMWRNGPMVNNDNLLVLLFSLLTLQLVEIAQGRSTRRRAVGIGIVTGLALLTKGFALALPLPIGVAYLLSARRSDRALRTVILRHCALALAIGAASGGWWWVRNVVVHGTFQPAGAVFEPPLPGFVPDIGAWFSLAGRGVVTTFWWIPARLSSPEFWVLALLPCVALLVAVLASRRRADCVLLALPAVSVVGIMTYGSFAHYASSGAVRGTNGRYVYAGLVGLAVLAALGGARLLRERTQWLPIAVLAWAGVVQTAAVTLTPPAPWGVVGVDSLSGSWRTLLAWSPWSTFRVTLVATGALIALLMLAVAVLLESFPALRPPWLRLPPRLA